MEIAAIFLIFKKVENLEVFFEAFGVATRHSKKAFSGMIVKYGKKIMYGFKASFRKPLKDY